MAAERKYIDAEDEPNLADVAREVHKSGESVVVREDGRALAVFVPLPDADDPVTEALRREERHKRLVDLAGSMKGLVDEERLREIYRSRSVSSRPPVEL
jgi:hypothetical protein